MDLNSNDQSLDESDLPTEESSESVVKLDLNLSANKDEEGGEVYAHVNTTCSDGKQVDLNQQEHKGLPSLLPADGPESPCTGPSSVPPPSSPMPEYSLNTVRETGELLSPVRTELYDDDVERRNSDHSRERSKSPLKDNHCTGEAEMVGCDDYSGKSLSTLPTKPFHNEMEAGDSAHDLSNFPSTVDTYYHGEEMARGKIEPYSGTVPPHGREVRENFVKISNFLFEKTDSINKELERENPDQHLESPLRMGKSSSDTGKVERGNSDLHSPGRTPKQSPSPLRRMSVSSERSLSTLASSGHKTVSPAKGVPESSCSPGRQKRSPSPERTGSDGKRVPARDHSTPVRLKSTSPWGSSRRDSQRRNDSPRKRLSASPRRRYSPPGHRRRDRSSSRSPIRKKDSSGHERDNRNRSQSRSPYGRDRYRRSPRRRYSPRCRSPPGYHFRRRSQRRPWSPPPNRSTGVGRPGKTLFVAGFSFVTTERDLEKKFSRFGRVSDVRIVRDKRTGDSRGFGFLSLERDEDADAAIRAIDQTEWNGRIVLVEKSKTHAP
ncbi:uncharacterized protein LOC131221261 isoform X2 [Magnolia sinica]|nr:uncharacterized protein LOC131221261 isoform X2 [Magnolia sinica]XP_058072449.1 uncharacterized protein LOC131221261 isoform X2 [Magnolia sinica]